MDCLEIEKYVYKFFDSNKDFSYNGTKQVITQYIKENVGDVTLAEYISLFKNFPTDEVKKTDYYIQYEKIFMSSKELKDLKQKKAFKTLPQNEKNKEISKIFNEMIIGAERRKLIYYLLTFQSRTLLIKTGQKQAEKDFLGYEFSNRRGYEGIHYYTNESGCINSSLYDDSELNNINKVNYFINRAFSKEYLLIPDNLLENMRYTSSSNLLTFTDSIFTNNIVLNKRIKVTYNCESMPLNEYVNIKIGGTPSRKVHDYFIGDNLWVSISEMKGQIITDTKEKITDTAIKESNVKLIKKGTTLLSFKLSIGKVAMAGTDLYTNEAIAALEIKDRYKYELLDEYLFYLFKSKVIDIEGDTKAFGISLNSTTLGELIIPRPSIAQQRDFINEFKKLEEQKELLLERKSLELNRKWEYVNSVYNNGYKEFMLGDSKISEMKRGPFGGSLKKECFVSSGYKVYEQKHAINNNFEIGRYYIAEEKFKEMFAFQVKPKDIIMSCSGTIGKFALAPNGIKVGIINQALLRFRPKERVLPEYLKLCLEHITEEFQLKSHGQGLQNVTSIDTLKVIKIPVPDTLEEQQKIIDDIRNYIDQICKMDQHIKEIEEKQKQIIVKYI